SGSVFLSADINLSAAQSAGTPLQGDYFLHLGDGGTSLFYDRVFAQASGSGYVMALGTSSGTTPTYGTTVLNFNQTYHIVAEDDFVAGAGNDTGALYLNPSDPIFGGNNLYVAATTQGTDATTIGGVYLRQGSATLAPTAQVTNIAVAIPTVPEPASFVLIGLGIVGFIGATRLKLV